MNFIKNVLKAIWSTIKKTINDIINNAETLVIMSTSAVGISAILQQIPFHYTLPLWIDSPMVIPILSIGLVYLLVSIYQWRTHYVGESI